MNVLFNKMRSGNLRLYMIINYNLLLVIVNCFKGIHFYHKSCDFSRNPLRNFNYRYPIKNWNKYYILSSFIRYL